MQIFQTCIMYNNQAAKTNKSASSDVRYLRLSKFIVMMWKPEVNAASMNVQWRAKNVTGHHWALNVPTRSALNTANNNYSQCISGLSSFA